MKTNYSTHIFYVSTHLWLIYEKIIEQNKLWNVRENSIYFNSLVTVSRVKYNTWLNFHDFYILSWMALAKRYMLPHLCLVK